MNAQEAKTRIEALIKKHANKPPAFPVLRSLKNEPGRATVTALQTLLSAVGLKEDLGGSKAIDGRYGPKTMAAVRKFAESGKGKNVSLKLAKKIVKAAENAAADAEKATTKKTAPAKKTGGTKKAAPARKTGGTKKAAPARKTGVTKKATPAKTTGGTKKATPAKKVAGATNTATKSAPEKGDFNVDAGVTASLLNVNPTGQQLENWCWPACTEMMVGYLRSLGEVACPTCGRTGHHENDITQGQQMNRRLGDPKIDCRKKDKSESEYKACDRTSWPYFYEFEPFVQSTKWAARRHILEERGLQLLDGGPRLRLQVPPSDWQLRSLTYGTGLEFKKRLDQAECCALSWEMLAGLLDRQRPVAFSYRFQRGGGHLRLAAGYAVTPDPDIPGGRKWVAVCDPLPPGTGEISLIPYESYRDGPYGRHWRDYWVAPRAEEGPPGPWQLGSADLRVGRELVATYETQPEDPLATKAPTVGHKLLDEDRVAAVVEAEKGLEAVEAIAIHAEDMAIALGMGGNFLQVFGGALVSYLGDKRGIHPEYPQTRPDIPDVSPDELELNEAEPIPVYDIGLPQLKKWDSETDGIWALLDRPREIIWEITRPNRRPFTFFSTVTVRRDGERWRLASIGRAHLMAAIANQWLFDYFGRALVRLSTEGFDLERLVTFLKALGLLEPIVRNMADDEVRSWAERLGYPAEEVHRYLWPPDGKAPAPGEPKKRGTLRVEELIRRAKDHRDKRRQDRENERDRELEELRGKLRSGARKYHSSVWAARTKWAREELAKATAKHAKGSYRAQLELVGAIAANVADPSKAEALAAEADWQETSTSPRPDDLGRFELLIGLGKEGAEQRSERLHRERIENLLPPLREILNQEKIIDELCAKPKRDVEDLQKLLDAERDQEIAWRELLDASGRVYLSAPGKGLGDLVFERKLDREIADPEAAALISRIDIPKPKFILNVQPLYQLFIGYSNDEVVPVYLDSFRPARNRIEAGELKTVLEGLHKVAKGEDSEQEPSCPGKTTR